MRLRNLPFPSVFSSGYCYQFNSLDTESLCGLKMAAHLEIKVLWQNMLHV